MHVFFSGIGGVGIGPLALIAKQAGYEVSGSDASDGLNVDSLRRKNIKDIHIGQTTDQIAEVHAQKPIDWFVYSSALTPDHPELEFCRQKGIKTSKRDEFINEILSQKQLKLLAIAGTHGKTTTTAMVVWLFKQLGIPASYSLGARVGSYDMSGLDSQSQYFIYECDEFDRNFLAFKPYLSVISGIGYDHHEIYPAKDDYYQAFSDFINQSQRTIIWQEDFKKLNMLSNLERVRVENEDNPGINQIKLTGLYNRRDGWLAIQALANLSDTPTDQLVEIISKFPGASRRFEEIIPNLYTDDAHTPEKIKGAMSVAKESAKPGQEIVVIYEPLTNRRMHYTAKDHKSVFEGASAIYWVPSYLAREDPNLNTLLPRELIEYLSPGLKKVAHEAKLNDELKHFIQRHLHAGHLVVGMSGGGAGGLDDWLRQTFEA